nr:MAG: major capsid protein [Microviridae sp.]
MKFSIGVGQKMYNHVGQVTNSSSCGFGEVQPVFSAVMLPKSTMSVKIAQKARLLPMPYPTFGHLSIETVGKYVSFGDVFPQLDNLLSGLPYNYLTIGEGNVFQYTSALVKSFPFINNRFLQGVLLSNKYSTYTTYADSTVTNLNVDDITPDGADYVQRLNNAETKKVDLRCYKYNDRGLRLRKILIGLGYNPSLDDSSTLNLLPLLCYYKAYFDEFAPKRFVSFQDTRCFALIKLFEKYPSLFVDGDNGFKAGDVISFTDPVTNSRPFNDLILEFFHKELSDCFATDPTDWVSMHTSAILNGTADAEPLPSDVSNPGSLEISNTGVGSPVSSSASKITKVQFDLLRRITSSVTRDSLVGRSIKKWIDNKYGADITNQIYEDTITLGHSSLHVTISDVESTADTFTALSGNSGIDSPSPTGSLIGSYAGKGYGDGVGQYSAKSKSFGLFVVLMWLKPHEDYFQGVDTRLCAKRIDELPQPLYDGIGYEITPRSAIWSDNGLSVGDVQDAAQSAVINDSSAFGYAPRYSGFKRYKSVINGDMSLRSKHESSKCMYLDKEIIFRSLDASTPLSTTNTKYLLNINEVPRASTEWRYIMKYPWLQNYNRIFYAPGQLQWSNGPGSLGPSLLDKNRPHDDNVLVHSLIQIAESNYLRPLSQSYDTFEVNGTTTISSSGE